MRMERQTEAKLCTNLKSVVESLDFIVNALKDTKQGSNMIKCHFEIPLTLCKQQIGKSKAGGSEATQETVIQVTHDNGLHRVMDIEGDLACLADGLCGNAY